MYPENDNVKKNKRFYNYEIRTLDEIHFSE